VKKVAGGLSSQRLASPLYAATVKIILVEK